MSKSQEILERGRQERATFTPEPDSAPTRAYWYWVNKRRDGVRPRNENFCHFWRVILIWAPLAWFMDKVKFAAKPIGWIGRQFKKIPRGVAEKIGLSIVGVYLLVLLVIIIMAAFQSPASFFLVLGIIAAIAAFVALLVFIGGKVSERNRLKREAAARARTEASRKAWEAFWNGLGPDPTLERRRETEEAVRKIQRFEAFFDKFAPFFKAVGEFCLVAVNAVRVNKWKICPLVEVPVDKSRNA